MKLGFVWKIVVASICVVQMGNVVATPAALAAVTRDAYLQMPTPTAISFRWRTNIVCDSRILYGTIAGVLDQTLDDTDLTTEHEVRLTGLTPSTKYYYSVGTTTQVQAYGAGYYFVTPPVAGTAKPTRIWAMGDFGWGSPSQQSVRNAYYTYTGSVYTDLGLSLGDNEQHNGLDVDYQTNVFSIYATFMHKSTFWPGLGNHDVDQASDPSLDIPYFRNFTLPANGECGGVASLTEKYFSFDYGNIHVIELDSQTSSRLSTGEMAEWLRRDLAANRSMWTIAYWHHPPYTHGTHNSDTDAQSTQIRENLLPILEQGGVDVVLCGHSHVYERSWLIDGNYTVSTNINKINSGNGRIGSGGAYKKPTPGPGAHEGTVYCVVGTGGTTGTGSLNHPVMYRSLSALGSLVLDINGTHLDAKYLDSNGAIQDYFTIIKGGPTVSVASPADATFFSATDSVILAADVTTNGIPVTLVQFYDGASLIGQDTDGLDGWSTVWGSDTVGSHTIIARAIDADGTSKDSSAVVVNIAKPVVSVGSAKSEQNGTPVIVSDKVIVTLLVQDQTGGFYAQSEDGSAGIRVMADTEGLSVGDRLSVKGIIAVSSTGEKTLGTATYARVGVGTTPIRNKTNRTAGLVGSYGVINQGLLTRIWGRVTLIAQDLILIDDGSAMVSPYGANGLKVTHAGGTAAPGDYIGVVGILTSETVDGYPISVLKGRDGLFASDFVLLNGLAE
ncbi:MAG: metallophosphoesterase family protein [Armatimonadota bacterium]